MGMLNFSLEDLYIRKTLLIELGLYKIEDFHNGYALANIWYENNIVSEDPFYISRDKKIIYGGEKKFYSRFSEGLVPFHIDKKYGFINDKGEIVIKALFEYAGDFHNGYAFIKLNEKYGVINNKGEIIIEAKYDYPIYFENGLAEVIIGDKHFYIDIYGNENQVNINDIYGLFPFEKDGKYGFMDIEKNIIIDAIYDSISMFNDSYSQVQKDGKYGLIDIKGNVVVPIKFDSCGDYSEGLVFIKLNNNSYYIDINGNEVLSLENKIDYGYSFNKGYAILEKDGKYGLISKKGDKILDFNYYKIEIINENFIICSFYEEFKIKNFFRKIFGKYKFYKIKTGVVNDKGKIIIPFDYDYYFMRDGYITLDKMNGKIREFYNYFYDGTLMSIDDKKLFSMYLEKLRKKILK